ncbi:ComEC/Rec2 family competence protein [Rhizobium sp. G187]|uniref:ComEC/Rec2 family competence protein n=1 Tax=Rhizobium sp. G187 TaxID=3451352 RepID=UPI003EE6B71E
MRHRLNHLNVAIVTALQEEARHGHLFLFVPVWLGLGAVIWFLAPAPPSTVMLSALLAVCLCGAIVRRASELHRAMFLSLALMAAGMLLAGWETHRAGTTILDQPVVTIATGIVERREAGSGAEWRYVVRLTATAEPTIRRRPERVSLLARSRHEPVAIGAVITGRVRLSPPSGPALPGMNDFAFQSYYAGIGAVGFFLGPPASAGLDPEARNGWLQRFDKALFSFRDRISSRIRDVLPGDTGAFAASIITGERRSMSPEATEALRVSGLAHITAISGLNMALAAGIFFVGLRATLSLLPVIAQRVPIKKLAAGGALVATTGYVLISGYQISALRAYLMTAIMLTAVLLDRPAISLRNFALAAIGMLVVQPSSVMGPSFQMSFAATAALIAGYAGWTAKPPPLLPRGRSLPARFVAAAGKFAGGTLATSLIGGMATAIFSISHFHRLSTHGLEANLAAMPLISVVVMPAGFVAMLLMPFGLDAPFLWVMGAGLDLVMVVAHTVAAWGDGYVFPRQPAWFIAGTVLGLLLLTLLRTRLRLVGACLFIVTAALAWLAPLEKPSNLFVSEDGRLVAFFVDTDRGILATNKKKPPAFLFDQWRPVLDVDTVAVPIEADVPPLPERAAWSPDTVQSGDVKDSSRQGPPRQELSDTDQREAAKIFTELVRKATPKAFTCLKGACVAKFSTRTLMTLDRPDLLGAACDTADIVILASRSRMSQCRSGTILFTESTLRMSGALEIEIAPGRGKKSSIQVRAAFDGLPRPWTAHRLYDWRTGESADKHDSATMAGIR